MRIAFLFLGLLTLGAWSLGMAGGAFPVPPLLARVADAFGAANEPGIVDINPVQTYRNVIRQVTSGRNSVAESFASAPVIIPPGGFPLANMKLANPDTPVPNGFAANVVTQNQQFNQRMEDVRNTARNPAGWHGASPF